MLVDLRGTGVTGRELEQRLDSVHITVNKNAVPGDPEKPTVTSGVRLGTPAVTTRGFGTAQSAEVGDLIADVVFDYENKKEAVLRRAELLCSAYPVYR